MAQPDEPIIDEPICDYPMTSDPNQPHLKRVLGRFDLVLLFVVAVFNLNVVPSIAANGGVTVWLWIVSLVMFFWPQGIAVIELAHRYPGEGGVYLWAKEVFGDFHGFLSGWCYWTNNMLYVPTVMLYFVGVSVYVLGPTHLGLADNKVFASTTSLALLALLTLLNIVGLGVGKWINNLGAIGTFLAAAVLIGLGVVIYSRFGTTITAADFKIPADPRFVLNSFGVICFGLVGLELASVMGDEIQDPRRTFPGAVAWGDLDPRCPALCPEFIRRNLLRSGWPRTCLCHGRRDSRSSPYFPRRRGLGRYRLRRPIRGGNPHFAHRRGKKYQCTSGYRPSRQSHVWQPRPRLDHHSICPHAQSLHRRYRFRMDGRLCPHSLRRRPRFVHALLAWQDPSSLRHTLCRVDRAGNCLRAFGSGKFLRVVVLGQVDGSFWIIAPVVSESGGRGRSVSEASFPGSRASARPIPLYVRCAHSTRCERSRAPRPVQPHDDVSRGHQRLAHHCARHRAGVFSRPADYIAVVLRTVDVRRYAVLCWPRRIFLLRLRPPQSAATGLCRDSRLGCPGERSSPLIQIHVGTAALGCPASEARLRM